MNLDCSECDRGACKHCPVWAAFECDLCNRDTCEDCTSFKYALWVLAGLLEKPEIERVIWPCA